MLDRSARRPFLDTDPKSTSGAFRCRWLQFHQSCVRKRTSELQEISIELNSFDIVLCKHFGTNRVQASILLEQAPHLRADRIKCRTHIPLRV